MATPTQKQRKQHPASDFGDPADEKYPLWGGRAGNAKARAVQEYNRGKLSKAKELGVIRRANKKEKSK